MYKNIRKQKALTQENGFVREQLTWLKSMHFWRNNQIMARKNDDKHELKRSDKAIRFAMEQCDELGVTFKLQNEVLYAAEQNKLFSEMESKVINQLRENNEVIKRNKKRKQKMYSMDR